MLSIQSPFDKPIVCIGYHRTHYQQKFVVIGYYLRYTKVSVKMPANQTLHINAKGLKNFPFKFKPNGSFVTFRVPTYIEQYRNEYYDTFLCLLDSFLHRIWFE